MLPEKDVLVRLYKRWIIQLMLKKRIITASILFPIVLITILKGTTYIVDVLCACIFMLACWEWNKLIGVCKHWHNIIMVCSVVLMGVIGKITNLSPFIYCTIAFIWWIISLVIIALYPKGKKFLNNSIVGILIGIILFIPTGLSIDWLHSNNNFGPIWVIYLCCLVWGADIGAYFVGRAWGKKKLLPNVSPGKSWLGVIGAFLFTTIITLFFTNIWLHDTVIFYGKGIKDIFIILELLTIIVVIFSIIGDLVESLFKRLKGVKDSGTLLPGHGGVLDRIDGLLAAVPIFVMGIQYI